jgi:hypothetical protein
MLPERTDAASVPRSDRAAVNYGDSARRRTDPVFPFVRDPGRYNQTNPNRKEFVDGDVKEVIHGR